PVVIPSAKGSCKKKKITAAPLFWDFPPPPFSMLPTEDTTGIKQTLTGRYIKLLPFSILIILKPALESGSAEWVKLSCSHKKNYIIISLKRVSNSEDKGAFIINCEICKCGEARLICLHI
ncbi:hypothetical protein E2320_005275, partial [Naja naja]